MKTSYLMCVVIASALCACATKQEQAVVLPGADSAIGGSDSVSPATGKPLDKPKVHVDIPSDALEPCPPLVDMKVDNPSGNDALKQKGLDAGQYAACRKKNGILVKIIKDAFNIK